MTEPIRPAELAQKWGCAERRIRETARRLGACAIIGKNMLLDAADVEAIRRDIDPDGARIAELEADLAQRKARDAARWPGVTAETQGHIYFLLCNDRVKIGFARDVRKRLKHVRILCPYPTTLLGTMPGTLSTEASLHEMFAKYRVHGEWFSFVPPVEQFIHEATRGSS